MNIISQLRTDIQVDGTVVIDIDTFNQLQKEWITRCMDDESLAENIIKADAIEEMMYKIPDDGEGRVSIDAIADYEEQLRSE